MNELPGASNLQINGYANCGRKEITEIHQDGIQVLAERTSPGSTSGSAITTRGCSTCQGAGGAFFYSMTSTQQAAPGRKVHRLQPLTVGWRRLGVRVRRASARGGTTAPTRRATTALRHPCASRPRDHARIGRDLPAMEPESRPLGRPVVETMSRRPLAPSPERSGDASAPPLGAWRSPHPQDPANDHQALRQPEQRSRRISASGKSLRTLRRSRSRIGSQRPF